MPNAGVLAWWTAIHYSLSIGVRLRCWTIVAQPHEIFKDNVTWLCKQAARASPWRYWSVRTRQYFIWTSFILAAALLKQFAVLSRYTAWKLSRQDADYHAVSDGFVWSIFFLILTFLCRSLTGELSLSCARPTADGWPLMWVIMMRWLRGAAVERHLWPANFSCPICPRPTADG